MGSFGVPGARSGAWDSFGCLGSFSCPVTSIRFITAKSKVSLQVPAVMSFLDVMHVAELDWGASQVVGTFCQHPLAKASKYKMSRDESKVS